MKVSCKRRQYEPKLKCCFLRRGFLEVLTWKWKTKRFFGNGDTSEGSDKSSATGLDLKSIKTNETQ